jgi:hypothetical protein
MALDFETVLTTLETNLTDILHQLSEVEWASFTDGLMKLSESVAQVSGTEELESLTDDLTELCARYSSTKVLLRETAACERRLNAPGAGSKPEIPIKELMNRFIGFTQQVRDLREKTVVPKGKRK